jgi:hypothetical protein
LTPSRCLLTNPISSGLELTSGLSYNSPSNPSIHMHMVTISRLRSFSICCCASGAASFFSFPYLPNLNVSCHLASILGCLISNLRRSRCVLTVLVGLQNHLPSLLSTKTAHPLVGTGDCRRCGSWSVITTQQLLSTTIEYHHPQSYFY